MSDAQQNHIDNNARGDGASPAGACACALAQREACADAVHRLFFSGASINVIMLAAALREVPLPAPCRCVPWAIPKDQARAIQTLLSKLDADDKNTFNWLIACVRSLAKSALLLLILFCGACGGGAVEAPDFAEGCGECANNEAWPPDAAAFAHLPAYAKQRAFLDPWGLRIHPTQMTAKFRSNAVLILFRDDDDWYWLTVWNTGGGPVEDHYGLQSTLPALFATRPDLVFEAP